ncbi:UNVERIFIED_CONTAM: hypothetical protein GTU68_055571 [Idotea baltica]|nr:hypothetical protein [Idotea baltica]
MLLFALVVIMIAVGGLTRLTDSGLSITEWKPLSGALPPTSAEIWQSEFDKYRAIPEYQLQNKGMTLAEFKVIYWWEWGHRQLGRVIGLVWALGFFYFLLRKQIPTGWTPRLLGLGALGGLQGAIGWWMVSSGLTGTMLDVASYRLATHLGLAFVILGLISWYVFLLGRSERDLLQVRRSGDAAVFSLSTLLGALVAGIDAGRNYTDWPLMAGGVFPPDPFELTPIWRNFFEDDGLVQFIHRVMGYILFVFGIFVVLQGRKSSHPITARAYTLIGALLVLQMLIGIMTVMYSAPWQIAIIHQLGAVALWVAILRGRYLARYPLLTSLRGATA